MLPRLLRRWSWVLLLAVLLLVPASAEAASGNKTPSVEVTLWQFIRASGLVAFLLLTVSTAMGIAVNVRALDGLMRRAWVYEAHQTLSVLALVMTAFHILLLLVDPYLPFRVLEVLVPFAARWRPIPSALGTIGLYLTALLIVTSYARQRIGQKAWRLIHYGGFAGWLAALLHGVASGSDSGLWWVQWLYLFSGASVGFLTIFRVLAPSGREAAGARRLTTR